MRVFCQFLEDFMDEYNALHSHNQPQVMLSQPAKAAPTVVELPRVAEAPAKAAPTVPPIAKKQRKKHPRLKKALGLLLLVACTALLSIHLYDVLVGTDESAAIGKVYQDALPSVVLISAEFPGTTPDASSDSGTGSGVIIRSDGVIVTNAHVVKDATAIAVTLHTGRVYPATLLGLDESTDLAVLKIEAKGLATSRFANTPRMWRLRVGETAIVIGNPLGAELTSTLTVGVISAVDRPVETEGSIVEMLQTDAAVSPGNSGGPMYDTDGRIIGIITSKVVKDGAEGLGFAIPADVAAGIIDELILHGRVASRPMLGVTVQVMDQETVDYYKDTYGEIYQVGIIVTQITPGSAVERAGLQLGDKILKFNGFDIKNANELNYLKEQCGIGQTATLTIDRDGTEMTLTFKLESAR